MIGMWIASAISVAGWAFLWGLPIVVCAGLVRMAAGPRGGRRG